MEYSARRLLESSISITVRRSVKNCSVMGVASSIVICSVTRSLSHLVEGGHLGLPPDGTRGNHQAGFGSTFRCSAEHRWGRGGGLCYRVITLQVLGAMFRVGPNFCPLMVSVPEMVTVRALDE